MFGIGFGEILIVILIIFLISPKDVPRVLKKVGQFFGELERVKRDLLQMKKDVEDIAKEIRIEEDLFEEKKKKQEEKGDEKKAE
jgi:Sec-independent protein translocase protein TatA